MKKAMMMVAVLLAGAAVMAQGYSEKMSLQAKHTEVLKCGAVVQNDAYKVVITMRSDKLGGVDFAHLLGGYYVNVEVRQSDFPDYLAGIWNVTSQPGAWPDHGNVSEIMLQPPWRDTVTMKWTSRKLVITLENKHNSTTNIVTDPPACGNFSSTVVYTVTVTNIDKGRDDVVNFVATVNYAGKARSKDTPKGVLGNWSCRGTGK